ncbi:hypothetical protein AVEN_257706-1 [Araneus ventricosus]|uniref:DNA-directed DNA polymerase n=1 Tax=Araneus ventricosus TaxID=182803 RepID=A0A4Y2LEK6_ARAVE|nr:hypothetical protein AVEN_257706-1 [Araneus ventricosus]
MYPSALVSGNLCYGTCTILSREEWLACPRAQTLKNIPYRTHGEQDFVHDAFGHGPVFQYPPYDPTVDNFVIVINEQSEAFLPCIVRHFVSLREHHQRKYKDTKDVYDYNTQLCIKILINSLFGVMASKEYCLAYLPIAMIIVTLARYQLLGAYHYLKRQIYLVCYADTDSLMVKSWPENNCDSVNAYLNLSFGSLKYEQRMTRLLVLSRKRYIYQTSKGQIVTKGFQKRTNEIIEFISQLVLENVWSLFLTYLNRCQTLQKDFRMPGWKKTYPWKAVVGFYGPISCNKFNTNVGMPKSIPFTVKQNISKSINPRIVCCSTHVGKDSRETKRFH